MKLSKISAVLSASAVAGSIINISHGHEPSALKIRDSDDQDCGPGIGSCESGQCCSGSGYCGTTEDYCDGSSCQLDYSDSCDTL